MKIIKKALSVLLCLIMAVSTIIYVPVSASDEVPGTDIPLIYVVGQGSSLIVNEDGVIKEVYPVSYNTDELIQIAKDNLDVFAKAVFTQEWTEFGNLIRDVLEPMFQQLALDENGESPYGVMSRYEYKSSQFKNKKKVNGKYPTRAYTFSYDWRMDPFKIADDLHRCIEDIMKYTGCDRIALSGRCEGACVTAAYMKKYNGEHVSDLINFSTALNGVTVLSKAFAGDIYLDADGVERFVYDLKISTDEVTNQLIESFVTLFNGTYGLDLACWSVNNVWDDIYLEILPQILIETFGTWPGFWSMVSDEDYVRAKENVFYNADMEKWAPFIDIIDNFHYNVQVPAAEDFKSYAEKGIDVFNIAKYGYQTLPVSEPADVISDSYVTVFNSSYGADSTTINTCFDSAYLENAEKNGTLKYISPDKQINAATCLFPERTWFIKNLGHKDFPNSTDGLIDAMVNIDGFTVDTDERYPQYLIYEDGVVNPMSEENSDPTPVKYKHSFFEAFIRFFKALFALIKNSLAAKTA